MEIIFYIVFIAIGFGMGMSVNTTKTFQKGAVLSLNAFYSVYLKILKERFGVDKDDAIRILEETAKELMVKK